MPIKTFPSLFILVALLCATACKKKGNPTPVPPNQAVDVYVGGVSGTATGPGEVVATYWKNGVMYKAIDTITYSYANSMGVLGNDVYLAGLRSTNTGGAATYWKNRVAVPLSNVQSHADAVSISNGSVYIAGDVAIPNNSNYLGLVCWKDGVLLTQITDGTTSAAVSGMEVDGSDIYISGGYGPSTGGYWKNGVFDALQDGVTNSFINAIAVSGNDVYLAGTTGPAYNAVPTYWKNGIAHPLAAAENGTQITGIAINGSDVYVCGSANTDPATFNIVNTRAIYWKNGVATTLSYNGDMTFAHAIAVNGTDVYVAGSASAYGDPVPVIWKNGIATKLSNYGIANSLVLVPR